MCTTLAFLVAYTRLWWILSWGLEESGLFLYTMDTFLAAELGVFFCYAMYSRSAYHVTRLELPIGSTHC
jgi:hypothetical protein